MCGPHDYAPGETRVFTLAFEVEDDQPCPSIIQNHADLSAGNAAEQWSNVVLTDIECNGFPELTLEKTGPEWIVRGGEAEYRLLVMNTGTVTAEDIVVIDDFHTQGFTFNPVGSSPECSFNPAEGVVCGPIDITAGTGRQFIINWDVPSTLSCGALATNSAVAHATNADSAHAEATTEVKCDPAILIIEKESNGQVHAGEQAIYTITVTNLGGETAQNVYVEDWVQAGDFVFNGSGSDNRCTAQANHVICGTLDIPAGATETFTVVFDTPSNTHCGSNISNLAVAKATNADNVWDHASVGVWCETPHLTVAKSGPSVAYNSEKITYTVTVTNTGASAAENVLVLDSISLPGFDMLPNHTDDDCGQLGNETVQCSVGTLDPGASREFEITFRVPENIDCQSLFLNSAHATSTNATDSNIATVETQAQCRTHAVDLIKTGPALIASGSLVTYDFLIRNTGQGIVDGIALIDNLTAQGFTFEPTLSSASCFLNAPSGVACGFFELSAGETQALQITWRAPQDLQ